MPSDRLIRHSRALAVLLAVAVPLAVPVLLALPVAAEPSGGASAAPIPFRAEEANGAEIDRAVEAWLAALAAGAGPEGSAAVRPASAGADRRSASAARIAARAQLIDSADAVCFPTCADDARMLSLVGGGDLQTLVGPRLAFRLWSPAGAAETVWGVFDGDAGGTWDLPADPGSTLRFRVYADPEGELDPETLDTSDDSHPALVQTVPGTAMADDDWSDFAVTNTAAARSTDPEAAGDHVYLVIAELVGDPRPEDWNNFKIRTSGHLRLLERPFAFTAPLFGAEEGCIVYPDACPNNNLDPTIYDGEWTLWVETTVPRAGLTVFDGDFDRGSWNDTFLDSDDPDTPSTSPCPPDVPPFYTPGADPCLPDFAQGTEAVTEGVADGNPAACGSEASATGCPADDRSDPVFQRSAGDGSPLRYRVVAPDGQEVLRENPSGNREWERLLFAAQAPPPTAEPFATPGTTTFTVPPLVEELTVKLWGGGGGGGGTAFISPDPGGSGGGAGFSRCILDVTPGETLEVHVGGGGGGGGTVSFFAGSGGGGGGRSAVLRDGVPLCVAGAGGGGGGATTSSSAPAGGAGGGPSGRNGGNAGGGISGGRGASYNAAGAGGSGPNSGSPGATGAGGDGAGLPQGNGGVSNGGDGGGFPGFFVGYGGGGGGGSGSFGGGGGAAAASGSNAGAGGGGGSGFVSGRQTLTLTGSGAAPANAGDPDYAAGTGTGGAGATSSSAAGTGGDGRVVVRYGDPDPTFAAGAFRVTVEGVDLSNLNAWRFQGEACPVDADGTPSCSLCPDPLDFNDLPAGVDLAATQPYADRFGPGQGIRFATNQSYPTLFDTAAPTCGDVDLGTPNECYGGPGVAGGAEPSDPDGPCGSGASNNVGLGNALIVQETSGSCTPNDKGGGGPNTLILTFDLPVFLGGVELLDLDEDASEMRLYDQFGDLLQPPVLAGGFGDNSSDLEPLGVGGVRRLEIALDGSGAIPALRFCGESGNGFGAGAETAFLAGRVWTDSDGDGRFEPEVGEIPLSGATVELELVERADGEPAPAGAGDGAARTAATVTDLRGRYRFTGLAAGTYLVRVVGEPESERQVELEAGTRPTADLSRRVEEPPGVATPREWSGRPWPTAHLVLGEVAFPRWRLVAWMERGGPGLFGDELVAELAAAKLNVGVGNPYACVAGTIGEADVWLAAGPLRLQWRGRLGRLDLEGRSLLRELETYNREGCR